VGPLSERLTGLRVEPRRRLEAVARSDERLVHQVLGRFNHDGMHPDGLGRSASQVQEQQRSIDLRALAAADEPRVERG